MARKLTSGWLGCFLLFVYTCMSFLFKATAFYLGKRHNAAQSFSFFPAMLIQPQQCQAVCVPFRKSFYFVTLFVPSFFISHPSLLPYLLNSSQHRGLRKTLWLCFPKWWGTSEVWPESRQQFCFNKKQALLSGGKIPCGETWQVNLFKIHLSSSAAVAAAGNFGL